MAEELFEEFGQAFAITLVPAAGGLFEVSIDDDLIFSKKATGRHAVYDDIAPPIRTRLGKG